MSFETMGDQRRATCQVHGRLDHWSRLVVERRTNGAGSHPRQAYPCNELIIMLDGRAVVRRSGDGQVEECLAQAGTVWTGPVGFLEKADLSDPIPCLHLCLPPALMEHSALADYGIDPSRVELAFVGGATDPLIVSIAQALQGLMNRPQQPTDRLFVDGMTAALAAHLIANYTIDRWTPPGEAHGLDIRDAPVRTDHPRPTRSGSLPQPLPLCAAVPDGDRPHTAPLRHGPSYRGRPEGADAESVVPGRDRARQRLRLSGQLHAGVPEEHRSDAPSVQGSCGVSSLTAPLLVPLRRGPRRRLDRPRSATSAGSIARSTDTSERDACKSLGQTRQT
jgi:hypothetical protein